MVTWNLLSEKILKPWADSVNSGDQRVKPVHKQRRVKVVSCARKKYTVFVLRNGLLEIFLNTFP